MEKSVYYFPKWYHGKYAPALYKEDINGDSLEGVIVVLNNDQAGLGNPLKDLHILNQIHDPYSRFYEAKAEPIKMTIKNDNLVNIYIGEKKHTIDIFKYDYINPRNRFFAIELIEYNIKNGKLFATVPAYVVRDDSVQGGYIGYLKLQYTWDEKKYVTKQIDLIKSAPKN
ncbi:MULTISPECIES: hypothetical protein [Bacillus]|uniref:Uncharacterized protein n=1 Tax=Bacillus toyonensis TaxID=155322 RepID=A0AAP8EX56_9BACI|nr:MULTISPECIES: hypothetical protein [Bacillus]MBK5359512.1 hypothetical protein [Bacillus sp. TH44]MBK5346991.1 hypothetical protein [Bacillus sp. TH45]MBK5366107.1 hypothetical protein [Bacillus sp. TH50]PEB91486.1 hypothetical protein CON81_21370 [Bacillus toyonensis]PHE04834.1 hypothetical protein COF62_30905 [Bacillus toyonensis]